MLVQGAPGSPHFIDAVLSNTGALEQILVLILLVLVTWQSSASHWDKADAGHRHSLAALGKHEASLALAI